MKIRKHIRKARSHLHYLYLKRILPRRESGHFPTAIRIPPLEGTLPTNLQAPLLIFAACDSVYFDKFGRPFLGSLKKYASLSAIHIHIYNPRWAQIEYLEGLQRDGVTTSLTFSWEHADLARLNQEERGIYYYSMRFARMASVLSSSRISCICLDIDALAVKPIDALLETVADADVAFYSRFGKSGANTKLLAGTLYVRFTPPSMRLLAEIEAQIKLFVRHGYLLEKLDQEVIYDRFRAISSIHPTLRFRPFDDRIFDLRFSGEGIIWYPKGSSKLDSVYREKQGLLSQELPVAVETTSGEKPTVAR
jgi:hypothetical protein